MVVKRSLGYKFLGRSHSVKGMFSTVIAAITFLMIITFFYLSSRSSGDGSILLGLGGMIACCMTVVGFILAIKAFREKDIIHTFPMIGLVFNGILLILYVVLYIVGLSS